jgi:hypothetical protein
MGMGTDGDNCLKALAEPLVRCLLDDLKTKIEGRFLDLRLASDAPE